LGTAQNSQCPSAGASPTGMHECLCSPPRPRLQKYNITVSRKRAARAHPGWLADNSTICSPLSFCNFTNHEQITVMHTETHHHRVDQFILFRLRCGVLYNGARPHDLRRLKQQRQPGQDVGFVQSPSCISCFALCSMRDAFRASTDRNMEYNAPPSPSFWPCAGRTPSTSHISQHPAAGYFYAFRQPVREAPLTMNFPPRSQPDLTPAHLPELGLPRTEYHRPLPQQIHGPYGIDGAFAFTQEAQLPCGRFATTQNHVPQLFGLSTGLFHHAQYDAELASSGSFESGFAASTASAAPTSPMGPSARPRKRKAPTLRADDCEPYKKRILDLHATQKLPLPKVRQRMKEEYGFKAGYATPVRATQSKS